LRRHPRPPELFGDHVAEHEIRLDRLVIRKVLRDLDLRTGEESRALRDLAETLDHPVEGLALLRAQAEDRLGPRGHDLPRLAAVADVAVHARVGLELLTPAVDPDEEPDDGVERVAPLLGCRPGVRGDAREGDALSDDAQTRAAHGPATLPGGV